MTTARTKANGLPPITRNGVSLRLPLDWPAAERLAESWMGRHSALLADPLPLLWLLVAVRDLPQPAAPEQLAALGTPRLLQLLAAERSPQDSPSAHQVAAVAAGPLSVEPPGEGEVAADLAVWAAIAAARYEAAELVPGRELADGRDSSTPAAGLAWTCLLLCSRDAPRILSACGVVNAERQPEDWLPGWWCQGWRALQSATAADQPAVVRRIAEGWSGSPTPPQPLAAGDPGDWLAALAQRLLRSESLEQKFAQQLEQAKLEALKEFAYGASHEINNPLANIAMRAQGLLLAEPHPERRRELAMIADEALRAHDMISDLMLVARPPTPRLQPTPLRPIAERVVESLAERASAQDSCCVVQVDDDVSTGADADQIAELLSSLLRNALEALGQGGEVRIIGGWHDQGGAMLEVTDTGPGIPAEIRPHIFEPYFSGREAGRGLGLGLAKCWVIMREHQGTISVSQPAAGGVAVRICFPPLTT